MRCEEKLCFCNRDLNVVSVGELTIWHEQMVSVNAALISSRQQCERTMN